MIKLLKHAIFLLSGDKTADNKNEKVIVMKTKNYIVKVLNGMALGLFASLIVGLILKQIGTSMNMDLLVNFGQIAQFTMGGAIGVGVAYSLDSPPLGIFASAVTGMIGGGVIHLVDGQYLLGPGPGEPVGALIGALLGCEISKWIQGKTPFDIVVVPIATIIVGGLGGHFIGPYIAQLMKGLGAIINLGTELQPIPMGIVVAVLMGIFLTLPISSAAIAISLGLSGLAAGAATIGCACQMIGFAFASYRENKIEGVISQGLGTSMLQIGNIVKNPWIWLPSILASAILGPIGTVIFKMENIPTGAGMGTSGLVGQFGTLASMGESGIFGIFLLHFILPAVLALIFSEFLRKSGKIKFGDLKLE